MSLLRSVASAPIGAETELRLLGGDGDPPRLRLAGLERRIAGRGPGVEHAAYEEIAQDAGGDWAELRADFDGALYVDMGRLTIATSSDAAS